MAIRRSLASAGVGELLISFDHRVDVRQGDRLAFQDVPALAGLAQLVDGTPGHHFAAVADEHFEHVLQVQRARLAVDQGHHVDAEHALQLGLGIEVVEDHLAHLAATQAR